MRCPACKSPLVVVEREEIELDWCVSCRGLWFDEGELELLGEKTGRVLDVADLVRLASAAVKGHRRCPRCPRRMEQLTLQMPTGPEVVIDSCTLHGFWLDRGELGAILTHLGKQVETDGELVIEFLGETFQDSVAHAATSEGSNEGEREMTGILVLLALVAVVVFWLVGIYNGLVRLRNAVKNAWSQIDVQLKRRYDLIPNLLETVKGYASHERETLQAVVEARQQAINVSDSVVDKAKAENMLSQTLRSLFAVAESYPDLKANQNFLALQEELASTENKISFSRQHYNDSAMTYNNKTEMFPSSIVANMFSFEAAEFFAVEDEAERQVPQVSFN